jgi:hypothetical protein
MINHINSVPRDKFKGSTSFEVQEILASKEFFESLNFKKINSVNVILKPDLFKSNDKDK